MKLRSLLYLLLFLSSSCKNATQKEVPDQISKSAIATTFVDAFYSFNRDSLASVLSFADETQHNILFYQKWAECGHYEIIERGTLIEKSDSLVIMPVTVKDDLMAALHIDFNVTDTFHLSIQNGRIRSIQTSSNDPSVYYEAKEWVKENRPELIDKACEVVADKEPTPCDCIQGMLKGFAEFVANR